MARKRIDCSVIIPVHDLEKYLDPMLDSLKSQDLGKYNVEIIFVLTCSDRSEDVIKESGIECKILQCEQRGCGVARNMGFEAAKGNYIWFLDGDDWLLSDTAIREVLDRAYKDDLNILYIPFKSDTYKGQWYSMVWQYLLKKEFVEDIRFYDRLLDEDNDYMSKVLRKVNADAYSYVVHVPAMTKPLYYYNFMRPGSNMYKRIKGEPL